MIRACIGIAFSSAPYYVTCAVLVRAQKGAPALNLFRYAGFARIENVVRPFGVHNEFFKQASDSPFDTSRTSIPRRCPTYRTNRIRLVGNEASGAVVRNWSSAVFLSEKCP